MQPTVSVPAISRCGGAVHKWNFLWCVLVFLDYRCVSRERLPSDPTQLNSGI
jgi:hypothetical protein